MSTNPIRMALVKCGLGFILEAHFADGTVWARRVVTRRDALRAYAPGRITSWSAEELTAQGWDKVQ